MMHARIIAATLCLGLFWLGIHAAFLLTWGNSAAASLVQSIFGSLITMLAGWALAISVKYFSPGSRTKWLPLIWIFIFSISIPYLTLEADAYLFSKEVQFGTNYQFTWTLIAMLTLLAFSMLNLNWKLIADKDAEFKRRIQADKLLRDTELAGLRQRLQPHFLFNSLNSINALLQRNSSEAAIMLQNLSDFLRLSVKKDSTRLHSIAEEVEYLRLYLTIEQVRFSDRLRVHFNIEEFDEKALIPALILQPIIENAIKFGLASEAEKSEIIIEISGADTFTTVKISNPYSENGFSRPGTGFGLTSVNRRLFLIYGRNNLLQTTREGGKFITTIIIPNDKGLDS